MFVADLMSITSVANKPGLSCPSISVQRPSWLSPLTTAYNFQYVYAEPALVSYFNCTCAAPLRAHYFVDSKGEQKSARDSLCLLRSQQKTLSVIAECAALFAA